jgi:hypothetical protein
VHTGAGWHWCGSRIRRGSSCCIDYTDVVAAAEARVKRLTGQIAALLPTWSLAPVVAAVQAMRGVGFIIAVTVVAMRHPTRA